MNDQILTQPSTKTVDAFNGSVYGNWTDFFPADDLFDGDGDVGLVFLSANDVYYSQEVNDPWYAAHQLPGRQAEDDNGENMTTYFADEPASVMGCKMRYQACHLQSRNCSRFGGLADMNYYFKLASGNRAQTMSWIWGAARSLTNVVLDLKASSLTSRDTVQEGSQGPLPNDQWQRDVENWHNIMLASYQDNAVEYASGPGDSGMLEFFWKRPETDDQRYLCKNQVCASVFTQLLISHSVP